MNLRVKRRRSQLLAIWTKCERKHIVAVLQRLHAPLTPKHIPRTDRFVPRGGGQKGKVGVECQAGYWPLMPRQHLQQPPRLQRPGEHLKGVHRARANDLACRIDGQAGELHWLWARHCPEVAVAYQVESANCAIEAGADESMSGREPLDGYHRRTVFAESHEAKAAVHVPHLDLAIISTGGDVGSIGGEVASGDVKVMPLLLQHVAL
mmetsp:Transcript_27794/g.49654  ORF Transcript_27794/g.49654 Transcript_27794/m.49654 type:complete len:207 (+) Transcript_27794:657-1277(+)